MLRCHSSGAVTECESSGWGMDGCMWQLCPVCAGVYACVYDLTARTSSIPAINNAYPCDTDELCLSVIIKISQAERKEWAHSGASLGFSISWRLMTTVFVYTIVENRFSSDNKSIYVADGDHAFIEKNYSSISAGFGTSRHLRDHKFASSHRSTISVCFCFFVSNMTMILL